MNFSTDFNNAEIFDSFLLTRYDSVWADGMVPRIEIL